MGWLYVTARRPAQRCCYTVGCFSGARGATHLAKSLLSKTCPPLAELDVSLNSIGDVGGHNVLMALFPRDNRLPLRDPAEDEHVRDMMQAEEKERMRRAAEATEDEPSHEGEGPDTTP